MAQTIDLSEAKAQLAQLVERVAAGEEIVIVEAGQPRAKLVPLPAPLQPRIPGLWEGRLWIADDFDAPLPDNVLADFEGNDREPPP